MKPPYQITSKILHLISTISQKIGEVNANYLIKNNPQLRKQNQIKTIHSSLSIEGNTLTEDQITAILENKRVLGSQKDIHEVLNAINIYDKLHTLKFSSEKDYLKAHKILMSELIENSGKYRTKGVGILKGSKIEHIAPPSENVPYLMRDLFSYLKDNSELSLIKSCVFHYEMEFIHPFMDGNGRMGRLWQTLILMNEFPLFEFLPFETLISKNQKKYYHALAQSDKEGHSTKFIEYMLGIIDDSLSELLTNSVQKLTQEDRISIFLENTEGEFTRKDYMKKFTEISSATASRDLKTALDKGFIQKFGDKNSSIYKKL
ncbi:cell filamentation protein Fic [Chryseobacterium sp. CBo1]|uniref:Fic family protein n=1 Tax=Chryseobacterium sp. CBo1 TaxID=1869230 RepID=UPI000810AADE|nr:Fic family protein [Chryseobacterium sp. CBo1]OCK51633.1 cell filamentation protein Fic [Chryseobacterium sp. CBo1]